MYVEASNARFWVVDKGEGPPVLFFHFGLGDWRVFEPELDALTNEFRCIAYDRRFFGRTEAPDEPYAPADDLIVLLDALDVERVALVHHYLTLREPELVTGLIRDFLSSTYG